MARIGIISCQNIKDTHCIGCLKCFKAMEEKAAQFEQHDDIEVVFMCDCGGCPGLTMPKMGLINDLANLLGRDFDTIHLGTCMVKAAKTSGCPIDPEKLKGMLEKNFGRKVIIGTWEKPA